MDPVDQVERISKRSRELFGTEYGFSLDYNEPISQRLKFRSKILGEYVFAKEPLPEHIAAKLPPPPRSSAKRDEALRKNISPVLNEILPPPPPPGSLLTTTVTATTGALTLRTQNDTAPASFSQSAPASATSSTQIALRSQPFSGFEQSSSSRVLAERRANVTQIRPEWHAPWKLMRVISGHLGWVRSVCVEPDNQWFATGAGDRTIKIWDLASGTLKLTLTGHIMTVRGLAVSPRHPYMFSCGEDKMVKCWDLEQNKVIRHYHGHLSGVYALDLHPTLDVLVTAGRDGVARVWDMRTRMAVHVLSGHKGTVSAVKCEAEDPQVITGSMDTQVRLWDLAAGKTQTVLTHHKKSVRALTMHPTEFTFSSGSADNIKQWKLPEGAFMHNYEPQHNAIINTLSTNSDGVMFSGADNGSMAFFDWNTGHKFQEIDTTAVPGSLDAENGIFASTFDHTGLRLITCEADKSIKIWREDPEATPETHPGIEWRPKLGRQRY
ncbi:WD40-repeat-containing domain protein [Limtongia smithiae]|uniref:WD40-repeat-containing domain protein n=1 Tax=Limtongia smithiae TaxID=1125753 RepID=UPI0034CE75F1